MTSHPQFMTSQYTISYISLLYLIWNWLYLTAHPLYLCHHTQIVSHITPIVCMITQAKYLWHHMNTYDITPTLYQTTVWHWHTLYSCHHTQDTCHRIHCSWAITYSVLIIACRQYVWYQTHYMYDIIWILCDITTTLYDIKSLYSWQHIHTIPDYTPTLHDMTYTLIVTSQTL